MAYQDENVNPEDATYRAFLRGTKLLIGALVFLLLWVACGPQPALANDTWVTATIASYHTKRSTDYNERNWGLGIEYGLSDTWRATGGTYHNSYYKQTIYGGALWLPARSGNFRAGALLAGVTGYTHAVDFVVLPTVMWEHKNFGVNLGVMPATDKRLITVIGLQLKYKFD